MSERNNGGPAFPIPGTAEAPNGEPQWPSEGMTLRDYFAAKAMLALLSHPDSGSDVALSTYANSAYAMADAMLAARSK